MGAGCPASPASPSSPASPCPSQGVGVSPCPDQDLHQHILYSCPCVPCVPGKIGDPSALSSSCPPRQTDQVN